MLSLENAIDVAVAFAAEISEKYPGKILAVYAVGSLGGGYYRPGQSDIDTVVIADFTRKEVRNVRKVIRSVADRYMEKYDVPKGFGAIVFAKEQLFPPYIKEEELIQEILRLKTQGRLIWGQPCTEDIPMPDWGAVKNDILNFQEWSDMQPPFEHSEVSFVNSTLMALKRYLLLKYHIIEFNKFKVIDLYLQNDPPLVNPEIFQFIGNYLYDKPYIWNEEIRKEYTDWNDELFTKINQLVLYD